MPSVKSQIRYIHSIVSGSKKLQYLVHLQLKSFGECGRKSEKRLDLRHLDVIISQMQIHWVANCVVPPPRSLSGGDRIMVECIRRWSKQNEITVFGWEGTRALFDHQNVLNIRHETWKSGQFEKFGFFPLFAAQTWHGLQAARNLQLSGNPPILISSSDFPTDSLPALRLKRRQPGIFWVASFYLFAPSLFHHLAGRATPGLKFCAYRPLQRWILRRILREADMILVTGEEDRARMIQMGRTAESVFAVRGGVDLSIPASVPEPRNKEYDAVFIGRFHPQKGLRELLQVWQLVVKQKQGMKLALIGKGSLEDELKNQVKILGLENSVSFLGFQDGVEKYKIIKASRLVVHPAIYDSGGMAAAEALACGLPGVAFDLPALKTYYPKGFLKVIPGDLNGFAQAILRLLSDQNLYNQIRDEALMTGRDWDWDIRAEQLWQAISGQVNRWRERQ